MSFTHLFIGLCIAGWVISVEYRLWANLRIHAENIKERAKTTLHAVAK